MFAQEGKKQHYLVVLITYMGLEISKNLIIEAVVLKNENPAYHIYKKEQRTEEEHKHDDHLY